MNETDDTKSNAVGDEVAESDLDATESSAEETESGADSSAVAVDATDVSTDDDDAEPDDDDGVDQSDDKAAEDDHTKRVVALPDRRSSGKAGVMLGAAALVVAAGAMGVALWPHFQSEPVDVAAVHSDEEVAAAKADSCKSFTLASTAIEVRSSMDPGVNPDSSYIEVLAANARNAFSATGPYLLSHVNEATPAALADAITKFANHSDEVGMAAWAGLGTTDPMMAEPLAAAGDVSAKITEMCREDGPEQGPAEAPDPAADAPPNEAESAPAAQSGS